MPNMVNCLSFDRLGYLFLEFAFFITIKKKMKIGETQRTWGIGLFRREGTLFVKYLKQAL